jgi:hypothetical protein
MTARSVRGSGDRATPASRQRPGAGDRVRGDRCSCVLDAGCSPAPPLRGREGGGWSSANCEQSASRDSPTATRLRGAKAIARCGAAPRATARRIRARSPRALAAEGPRREAVGETQAEFISPEAKFWQIEIPAASRRITRIPNARAADAWPGGLRRSDDQPAGLAAAHSLLRMSARATDVSVDSLSLSGWSP